MISNRPPPPEPPPADYRRRVVVKFRPGVALPYSAAAADSLARQGGGEWSALAAEYPGITLAPYFSTLPEATLRDFAARPPAGGKAAPSLASYFAIEPPAGVEPERVAAAVAAWPNVETAYVEGGPTPPPLDPSNDPRNASQGYQDAAPVGIGARAAWAKATGSGIGFVDLEQGWTLNHEDLAAAGITLISGVNTAYTGHGTAVLGEVAAVDNTLGGMGIAPAATTRVVSQYRAGGGYNTAEAILSAVGVMAAGDVLLLEAQTVHPNATGYVPVEVEQAVFDAIEFATAQGIVVVEAAGNGSEDLDQFEDTLGRKILNRGSPDFRDSGAIMVGAASSAVPHTRLGFSNFGSRIDCFGWGENIDTCGDGWTGNATSTYTGSFGGTSGASPIVTGAALLVQSWAVGTGKGRYSPADLRALLSDPARNTQSADPAVDRIGVMPDLGEIFGPGLVRRPRRWGYVLAWAWLILLGGLLITPGGTLCIKCGPGDPGYIGDPVIYVLAIGAIVLGILGLVNGARAPQAEVQGMR
jgi:hypothetical protein